MESNVCLICLEKSTQKNIANSTQISFYRNNCNIYNLQCICDVIIHNNCMLEWISKNPCCPICRKKMHKKVIISIFHIYQQFDYQTKIACILLIIKFNIFVLYLYTVFRMNSYSTQM